MKTSLVASGPCGRITLAVWSAECRVARGLDPFITGSGRPEARVGAAVVDLPLRVDHDRVGDVGLGCDLHADELALEGIPRAGPQPVVRAFVVNGAERLAYRRLARDVVH